MLFSDDADNKDKNTNILTSQIHNFRVLEQWILAFPLFAFRMISVHFGEHFNKFDAELAEQSKEHPNARLVAYFYGSNDEQGHSWCPDCRKGSSHP